MGSMLPLLTACKLVGEIYSSSVALSTRDNLILPRSGGYLLVVARVEHYPNISCAEVKEATYAPHIYLLQWTTSSKCEYTHA